MAQAYLADAQQFLLRPDPAYRIVGIAQQQKFRPLVGGFRFEVVDMDGARIDKILVTPPAPAKAESEE